jgi:hypothetical protein
MLLQGQQAAGASYRVANLPRVFPLDTDVTEEVLRTWEGDLAKARAEATAARRRVILAVHHATNLEVSDDQRDSPDDLRGPRPQRPSGSSVRSGPR